MNYNDFIKIVRRFLDGKATAAENQYLDFYYNRFDSHTDINELFNQDQISKLEEDTYSNILNLIEKRSKNTFFNPNKLYTYTIAASIAFLFIITSVICYDLLKNSNNENIVNQIYCSKPGNISKLTLSDGTLVWLNSKSKLIYPSSFNNKPYREIYLNGEAYLEVTKDKKHPFLVHTPNLTTRVLGTKFNIHSYKEDKLTEVTLLEGKVMLTTDLINVRMKNRKPDTLFLNPNEKASFDWNQSNTSLRKIIEDKSNKNLESFSLTNKYSHITLAKVPRRNALECVSWINGQLIFRSESIEHVLAALSRRYDVDLQVSPEIKNYLISISFNNESIEEILLNITKQVKRTMIINGQEYNKPCQFKKLGIHYYIE